MTEQRKRFDAWWAEYQQTCVRVLTETQVGTYWSFGDEPESVAWQAWQAAGESKENHRVAEFSVDSGED